MKTTLLIIDPQNDFCDETGLRGESPALPVPGAGKDLRGVAAFIDLVGKDFSSIVVTKDTHMVEAIERPLYWKRADGASVAPFTQISAKQVLEGEFLPKDPSKLAWVINYLTELESAGKYTLMVWPAHCVEGTWGHEVVPALQTSLGVWEQLNTKEVNYVLKGLNPDTEQYSAVRAEVPVDGDPSTAKNERLLKAVTDTDRLFVAGEALSHCVKSTMEDIFENMGTLEYSNVYLILDGMSSVPGFEEKGSDFLSKAMTKGVKVVSLRKAASILGAY